MASASAKDDATQKLVDEWEQAVSAESLRRQDALIRVVGAGGRLRDALEAVQRPPVSPEVREGMRDALQEAHQYDHDFDPEWDYTEDDDRYIDAILARFSFPPQPVYDEGKIARWLYEAWNTERGNTIPYLPHEARATIAAALVTALRGGELTREETNE